MNTKFQLAFTVKDKSDLELVEWIKMKAEALCNSPGAFVKLVLRQEKAEEEKKIKLLKKTMKEALK
jgi:hypothetical protein